MSVIQSNYQLIKENMSKYKLNNNDFLDQLSLANLVDNVNKNNLHIYYQKEDSLFKQKIDKLNLKFYLETEKYLTNQHNDVKCQESLFIILFQQISLYIEEIERLNIILQEKNEDPKFIKSKVEEYMRKQKDFETKEKLIQTLKDSKNNLEKKLSKLMSQEDKIKSENESLKRQNKFYQEQIQIFLGNKNADFNYNTIINHKFSRQKVKRNFSDNNNSNNNLYNKVILNSENVDSNNIKQNNVLIDESNEHNLKSNGQINNVINNNTNLSNTININNNINNNNKHKKDIKIIKSVKEKLTRNNSGDTNNNNNSNNNRNISSNSCGRCKSPIQNNTSPLSNKEGLKNALQKCNNELNEIEFLEMCLKKLKFDLLNDKNKKDCNNDNLITDYLINNDYNDSNKPIKTEVIISDLEDYNTDLSKKNNIYNNNIMNKTQTINFNFSKMKKNDEIDKQKNNKNNNTNTNKVVYNTININPSEEKNINNLNNRLKK